MMLQGAIMPTEIRKEVKGTMYHMVHVWLHPGGAGSSRARRDELGLTQDDATAKWLCVTISEHIGRGLVRR
jgi:hypothetical protein